MKAGVRLHWLAADMSAALRSLVEVSSQSTGGQRFAPISSEVSMPVSRRALITTAVAAGGALALDRSVAGALASAAARSAVPTPRAGPALRILILGGTGFTGPFQVRYAVERGHRVTIFNRGRTEADLPPGVEQLIGDRNDDLSALEGREWDVVIDNPATLPRWVRQSAQLLAGAAGHYVFISSISVYSDNSKPGMDESGPLATLEDPTTEEITGATFGGLKALAEQEAERAFPGRATMIRPGLIVGPLDRTDRFTYWPVRIDRGGEVLAPGDPANPVQIIDARDLAEWTIRMVEQRAFGVFNAVGPASPLTMAEMLYGIRAVTTSPVRFTWVDPEFLAAQEVRPWADMPVWVPAEGDSAGFARVGIQKALDRGLTFRPLAVTAADTLAWFRTLPADRQARLRAGIDSEREVAVLAAWRARREKVLAEAAGERD
jgi:2'-hydroxyisoflavone reductase